jgi:hypothetical protein
MMFGFSTHRRQQLTDELRRMAAELPALGVERAWLAGDLADNNVSPESALELVLVHHSTERFHRRPDFFTNHLAPRVATRFIVYTPAEFHELNGSDPILVRVQCEGEALDG